MTEAPGVGPLPEEPEAERQLLSAMLLSPAVIPQLRGGLRAEYFATPANRRIYAHLVALQDEGETVELLTLKSHLERSGELAAVGGWSGLSDLVDAAPTATNAEAHARLVIESAKGRRLAELGRSLVEAVRTKAATPDAIRAAHVDALMAETYDRAGRGFVRVNAADVLDVIERRSLGHIDGVPIGFPGCDNVTAGFQRGELIILGAVPKVGKSTFAAQIAMHVALGGFGGAAIVAAEMPARAVKERMLSTLSGVPAHRMQRGTLTNFEWQRLVAAESRLRAAPLWIDDEALPGLGELMQRGLALKACHPDLAVIVVDYLQLVQYRMKGRRGDEEISAVADGLKKLADRANVVVIAPAQLNEKAVESRQDKRPTRQDLSGSSGPVKSADFVALLYRPKLHEGTNVDADRLHVFVDAARRTPPFDFVLDWQATVLRAVDARWGLPADAPLPIPGDDRHTGTPSADLAS